MGHTPPPEPAPAGDPADEAVGAPRTRVLTAARELFVERGYLATTIGAIAEHAGVALRTIYSGYGSKVGILAAVQDRAVAGDADPIPMLQRAWVADLAAMSRPQALGSVVAHLAAATERTAPILGVISVAASDPGVRELLERLHRQRIETCRQIAGRIDVGGSALDADRLADELYALLGPESHQLLVGRRGWTRPQWEAWVLRCLA